MMPPARYIIRRQVLEVASKKPETNTPQLQEQVKAMYKHYFLPIIEKCCAAVDNPNKHLRLDKIVIDIENLDILNPNSPDLEKVLIKFEQNLMQVFQSAAKAQQAYPITNEQTVFSSEDANNTHSYNETLTESPKQQKNRPTTLPAQYDNSASVELLQFFLQTGQLPWWADANDRQVIDKAILDIIEPSQKRELSVFLSRLKDNYYRARFIRNVSDETLVLFCNVLYEGNLSQKQIFQFQNNKAQTETPLQRVAFWEKVLMGILAEKNGIIRKNTSLEQNNLLTHNKSLKNTPPQYFTPKKGLKSENDSNQGIDSNFDKRTEPDYKQDAAEKLETDIDRHASLHAIPSKPSTFQTESDNHLYIQNAGLVLIAPYLPQFFENLGWIVEKKFVSSEKANRAVQILQFLADGQDEAPEFLLILPKILCGLDTDSLHAPEQLLDDAEKAKAENFLESLLDNAPELGLKTANALRGSFLLRQGVLRPIDNHWTLHIEVETYDLVLHKIPWNFQIIKLPWMKMPIFVDWALPNF